MHGATNISVEIKNGGISYIRITDNGKGIAVDDMEIAFERHATSKIRQAEDLSSVKSMGFRGEALASIAAIANVELVSKQWDAEVGNKIVVEAGNVLEQSETGCPAGTTITVKNLFFNTPVRYKFLKKDYTEAGYIEDAITRLALINPNIAFKLVNSGKVVIKTYGDGNLNNAVYSIYGKDIASNTVDVNYSFEDIKVKGVVGRPDIARSNRTNQLFFVNKRFVKDKTLTSATEQALKGILPVGKYAFLVLNIEMNPAKVDVNVHPAKLEVRFEEEGNVFKAVYHAIKESLMRDEIAEEKVRRDEEQTTKKMELIVPEEKRLFGKIFGRNKKEDWEIPEEEDKDNLIANIYKKKYGKNENLQTEEKERIEEKTYNEQVVKKEPNIVNAEEIIKNDKEGAKETIGGTSSNVQNINRVNAKDMINNMNLDINSNVLEKIAMLQKQVSDDLEKNPNIVFDRKKLEAEKRQLEELRKFDTEKKEHIEIHKEAKKTDEKSNEEIQNNDIVENQILAQTKERDEKQEEQEQANENIQEKKYEFEEVKEEAENKENNEFNDNEVENIQNEENDVLNDVQESIEQQSAPKTYGITENVQEEKFENQNEGIKIENEENTNIENEKNIDVENTEEANFENIDTVNKNENFISNNQILQSEDDHSEHIDNIIKHAIDKKMNSTDNEDEYFVEKNEENNEETSDEINDEKQNEENVTDNSDKEVDTNDFDAMYAKIFGRTLKEAQEEKEKQFASAEDIVMVEGENENRFNSFEPMKNNNYSVFEEKSEYNKGLNYKFIGVAFSNYIIIEIKKELYIIDQNAAHERLMYEKIKKNFYSDVEKDSQLLLLPDIINLNHKEMDIVRDNWNVFERAGFEIEEFGENTIKLTGVPEICFDLDTKALFLETLNEINTVARTAKKEIEEKFIATIAHKTASKTKMAQNDGEVNDLLEKLLKLPNPFSCPDGKPAAIKMNKFDLEKKFSRRK